MRLLLQLGADPMSLSREHHVDRSLTPVRPTPQTFKAELPWILHILVEHGADLKWATPETGNLLHYATNTAQWPIVHALLRMGVNPDIGGPDDTWNPLNCAFFQSPFELRFTITESLLRAGANPDILHPDGDHSLHKLIEKPGCPTKVFRDLLPYCRNLNVRNSRGQTPLHLVMSSDSSKPSYSSSKLGWAGLLIEAKADVTRRDSSGKTIVERALQTEGGFEVPLFVPRHVPTISVEPNKYKHMLYLHLNFLTDMGLRFGIPSLIPAKAVYDQFHAEVVYSRKNMVYRSDEKHMLFICGWGLSNETLDLFLNVKDALGRLPGHGGKMGTQFRTFWDDNCSDINAQGRHNRVLSSRTSRPWMTDFDGLEDRAARLDL
ncbi:ankyrin [Lophium mytilinum]|uniref:Ankyrin n=1 Tax=Lophium mytilinum TaxID=390894 RepID=A0A6A6R991_9PEZI|nr:ankyrin [Lophium mytilinum]